LHNIYYNLWPKICVLYYLLAFYVFPPERRASELKALWKLFPVLYQPFTFQISVLQTVSPSTYSWLYYYNTGQRWSDGLYSAVFTASLFRNRFIPKSDHVRVRQSLYSLHIYYNVYPCVLCINIINYSIPNLLFRLCRGIRQR
jgi:hypothetical protein